MRQDETELRFYLDENLSPEIIVQLRLRGIDAIRGPLRDDDLSHLLRATQMGRVVCSADSDMPRLHDSGIAHCGIVRGRNRVHGIGDWVKYLALLHDCYTREDMRGKLEYLFTWD